MKRSTVKKISFNDSNESMNIYSSINSNVIRIIDSPKKQNLSKKEEENKKNFIVDDSNINNNHKTPIKFSNFNNANHNYNELS